MGICISCQSTTVATSKLILPDGNLQEFAYPVKVSEVLHKNPFTFICNSDEMDFDDVVTPLPNNADLQPGQLYFALPLKRLNHPLQPEEMAALAVKASAALAKCSGGKRNRKNTRFTSEKGSMKSSSKVSDVATIGMTRKGCGAKGGKKQNFKVMLSVIPE